MNKLTAFMKDMVNTEIQATENNITMQMADMQGTIEQIRDKDMENSSDDSFYSEDKAKEEAEGEESGAVSYEGWRLCACHEEQERMRTRNCTSSQWQGQVERGNLMKTRYR